MHAILKRSLDDVGLHHEVLIDEVSRVDVVGMNATYFGCSQVHLRGFFCREERLHSGLVSQV
ncbi:hypothetical protein LMORI2_02580 [Limnohabitans sp. MORI2]|nr:hypothetical protein LMORI2_02580 [Limnohabitans sp. MORI2]